MPELPEVEAVRRSLLPHILGRTVRRVILRRADIVALAFAPAPTPAALLQGATLAAPQRHGKQLLLTTSSPRACIVQLGMSGSLVWSAAKPPDAPHQHCIWVLPDGYLAFTDPRRFGGLTPFPSAEALTQAWSGLGPDALAVTPTDLASRLGRSTRAIKPALLDQHVTAGVGNIYADEALFLAGISPRRRCRTLQPDRLDRLARAIRTVLAQAIEAGGSTIRSYRDGEGRQGSHQARHAVYGRGGQPCTVCGTALTQAVLGQRTTVWCRSCQT